MYTYNCHDLKLVFDHIASLSGDNIINKKAWIGGINIAHEKDLTRKCYMKIISGGQYDPQPKRVNTNVLLSQMYPQYNQHKYQNNPYSKHNYNQQTHMQARYILYVLNTIF